MIILHAINTIIWGVVMGRFLKLVIPNETYLRGYILGVFLMMFYYVGLKMLEDFINNKKLK